LATPEAPRPVDFGRTAADYDRYRLGFPDSFYERLGALGWIAPGLRVLDVGTGTGALALGLAARGLDVVGLDPSPELLDVARRRAGELGLDVPFVEGTAEATGMEPASFDLVTAAHCWWWFDGPRAVAEARRVLRPGGRLLMANFSYLPTPGSVPEATERLVLAHNPGWTKAGESGIHEEQIRDLDAGGLLDVQSFSYVEPATFTHEAWRGRMRACSGVGAALPPADVEAFDRDLAAMLAERFPEELAVPHRVFVATGRMPG
jgi:SAM-dependent methyltransferase